MVRKALIVIFSTVLFLTMTTLLLIGNGDIQVQKNKDNIKDNMNESEEKNSDNLGDKLNKIDEKGIMVKLYRSKENKVIELSLEEYVLGVVSAEMPAEFPIEALKAQAVASRTYVCAHMEEFGGTSSTSANGGNVVDTIANQVYYNKDERNQGWPEKKRSEYWNKITSAVKDTEGQILTYNGDLVMSPYFFSTSSGKTENGDDVFQTAAPYLKSVSSSGEEGSPKFKNNVIISNNEFINKINSAYAGALSSDSILEKDINIISRGEGGGVKEIKIGNVTMSGVNFRKILKLNSSDFQITYTTKSLIITTKGYGHGVGMSQFGAKAMAQNGIDYLTILQHYYTGVNIEKLDIVNKKIIRIK